METFIIQQRVELGVENMPMYYTPTLELGDSGSHTWEITVTQRGRAVALDGIAIAFVVRSDGYLGIVSGHIAGNIVSSVFDKTFTMATGQMVAQMVIADTNGTKTTLATLYYGVKQTRTGEIVTSDERVLDLPGMMALLDEFQAAETERETAEQARQSAEAQRAQTFAGYQGEIGSLKDDLGQIDNAVASGSYQFVFSWRLGFPLDGIEKTGGDGTNGITTDSHRLHRDAIVNYNTDRISQIRAFAVDSENNLGTFIVYTNGSIIPKTDNFYRLMAIPKSGIELTVDDSQEILLFSEYYAFGVKENKENIEKIKNGDLNNNSIAKEKLDFEVGDTVLSKLKEPKINILEYVTFAQGVPFGLDGYIQYDDRVSTDAIAVELGKHYYIEYNSQIYQLRAFMFDPDGTEHSFVVVGKSSYISFDYKIIRFCLILKDSTGTLDIETAKTDLKIYDYYAIKKPSKWAGKKAVVLGDSITEGIMVNDDKSQEQVAMQWWRFVADNCMLDKITAYGLSGSSIGNGVDSTESFVNRYQQMDDDADLVIVFGGTNDYGNITASSTATFGELSDTNDGTFCGAIRILCEGLIKKYIGKRIVFIAPIHRGGDFTKSILGKTLRDYVDAIKIICSDYGVKVIDALSNSGFAPSVPEFASIYMDALILHPNSDGHRMLGEYVSAELEAV